jgi:hypothetical protein
MGRSKSQKRPPNRGTDKNLQSIEHMEVPRF